MRQHQDIEKSNHPLQLFEAQIRGRQGTQALFALREAKYDLVFNY